MVTAFRFPFGNPEPAGENILVANPKTRITANARSNQKQRNTNMKSTINRQVYDTAKATLVAEDWNNLGRNDFHALQEQLYVTAKGNWFIYGWGGAMTKYADHEGNSSSEGERIVPMTRDETLAWCEEHSAQDAIDKHFSDLVSEA